MGLDTYAARTPVYLLEPGPDEDEPDEDFGCTWRDMWALRRAQRKRERAGGGTVFGGNYFRGKLYVELVRYVTGESLYQQWIPPPTVKKMAEAFARRSPEQTVSDFRNSEFPIREVHASEVADLQAFLEVCAGRGLGLVGSW